MELVVLVDDQNNPIGTMPKETVHTKTTPLHRGFSLFLFNAKGELLVTQRAVNKKTFPGVWTNTVCGHPAPDEDPVDAAKRRLKDELGIISSDIKIISPYRYQFADANGIFENEICPILVGHADSDPNANPDEIGGWKWVPWQDFLNEIKNNPQTYSPWCIEEAAILQKFL